MARSRAAPWQLPSFPAGLRVVLVMGVRSMAHGGAYDRRHSGGLMGARIGLQALAFVLMLVAIYLLAR